MITLRLYSAREGLYLDPFLSKACDDLPALTAAHENTAVERIGIRFTAVGRDFICADMPVDNRTRQPFGILHGGSSIVLAETLGSTASWLLVKDKGGFAAGIKVGGSHLKTVRSGHVTGICRPLKIGSKLHFWHIEIRDQQGDLVCDAHLTVTILWPR